MLVRVLGSAAGGGVPQWNCGCANCAAAIADPSLMRTGCSVAVSADGATWTVLNAPAELPRQLTGFSPLRRHLSFGELPFAQLMLTDAELDHAIGLLMLRQATELTVACTLSMRQLLDGIFHLVSGYLRVTWREVIPGTDFPIDPACPSGLLGRAIPVGGGKPPAYASGIRAPADAAIALQIHDPHGGCLVYAPCVPALTEPLLRAFREASLILLDGTFFSNDELIKVGRRRSALQLGHLPVGGPEGSLARLEPTILPNVVYTHLNNTNPLLAAQSTPAEQVRRAGASVATDGADYEL